MRSYGGVAKGRTKAGSLLGSDGNARGEGVEEAGGKARRGGQ